MKIVLITTLVLLAVAALTGTAIFFANSPSQIEKTIFTKYTAWKSEFGANINSTEEDSYRLSVFTENYHFANSFNAAQTGTHTLGMNMFATLTNEEYIEKHVTGTKPESGTYLLNTENNFVGDLPASIDWAAKGAVAPVEDQGSCGSCWAFSTKETLEGIYQIKTGNLEVLSAQQLTDCSTASFGCGGGYQISTYTYTQSNGIQTEASYPYVSGNTGRATPCTYNASDVVFKNTGSAMVKPRNNQQAIQEALTVQPLSVLVAASGITFQLYTGGILDQCGTRTDHAILLYGYDTTGSAPFYQLKNSWGTGWGEKGLAQFAMNGNGNGVCSVQSSVAYPTYNN